MRPGELVLARIKGEASIVRFLGPTPGGDRMRVSVGRNREARLPADRIILATGLAASDDQETESLRHQCETLAAEMDLSELWEVVRDEVAVVGLDDLADLHWGSSHTPAQRTALALHLEGMTPYFVADKEGYATRSLESVREIQHRRRREAENAAATASLIEHLVEGRLPAELTGHQSHLLAHLRGYAAHGDSYSRSATARSLLADAAKGKRDLQRAAFDLLVETGIFSPDEPLELERAGIVEDFTADVLSEAAAIDPLQVLAEAGRRDLTAVPAVTVDDEGTEDRDDALSLEIETADDAEDVADAERGAVVYRVGIHIADAGALIPPDGAVDLEAARRMATLYLPERRVTMLPPEVSNEKGSLAPDETRAALSLLVRVTDSGEMLGWEVTPSAMRSQAALTYDEADRAMSDPPHPWHGMLVSLERVADCLRRKRMEAGAIAIERPEMVIKVTSGDVNVKVISRASPARRTVAEFMILCNSLLAEFCGREELPAAYRSQEMPEIDDEILRVPEGPWRNFLMIRRFPPAALGTAPGAHRGLGVAAYIQATSPLRRYSDLVMQRQISRFLAAGRSQYSTEAIASVAQRADAQLRELGRLEEDRKRYWFLKYLDKSLLGRCEREVSEPLEAIVLENQPGRHTLLELADYPFRLRAQLPPTYAPGDTATLRLHTVDLWRRVGRFVHVPSTD